MCGANRLEGRRGACGADDRLMVARAALHYWEEPPLSGERGSGAVFFSNCPLKCVYCQNADISTGGHGAETTVEGLCGSLLSLQRQGAHNINLVTATHYVPQAVAAVELARSSGLTLPVLYNTSSYERPQTLAMLADTVQIWLPDYKYASSALAASLSMAADYPGVALEAIAAMVGHMRDRGGRQVDDEGIMRRGVIVRHLVLPGHVDDSLAALAALWQRFGNDIDLSVMNQYTPVAPRTLIGRHPELARNVSDEEYEAVLDFADILGFENLWWQQGGTVDESFIPAFDGTGVCPKPADGAR